MAAFGDLRIIDFLKTKMKWHQARQHVLAANVANADTPRYRARELRPMEFGRVLKTHELSSLSTARTHQAHIKGGMISAGGPGFASDKRTDWEITPEGNAVVLEEQMMKVAKNQFDYQMASTVYSRSLGLLKTALGRNG